MQMAMSATHIPTTAVIMLSVSMLLVATTAPVKRDTMVMDSIVQVGYFMYVQDSSLFLKRLLGNSQFPSI